MNYRSYSSVMGAFLIYFCFTSLNLFAQNEALDSGTFLPCLQCYDKDSLFDFRNIESCCNTQTYPAVQKQLDKRRRNYDFFSTMLKLQPPSLISGGTVTSYTINTLGYDKKNFVLDADVQIPIPIGGKRMGLNTFQIIPRFMVRIFQDDPEVPFGPQGDTSLPVRTPSTIPGIAYYFSPARWWNPDRYWNRELNSANKSDGIRDELLKDNRYLGIYAYHYSNGQDGQEIASSGAVNTYNGNYGEQVVFEFIYGQQRKYVFSGDNILAINSKNKRRIAADPGGSKELFVKSSHGMELNWRLSFEWHPYGLSNKVFRDVSNYGNYSSAAHMMGRARLNGRASLHLLPKLIEYISSGEKWCLVTPEANYERWRFMVNFSYIMDSNYYRGATVYDLHKIEPLGMYRRLNLALTAFHVIKRSKYAAVFAEAAYNGSDPYNIYFNDSLWQIKFGLAFGFFDQPNQED